MRFSQCLCAQHIGRMIKKHWYIQNKQIPEDIGSQKFLQSKGIEIIDANEFIKPSQKYPRFDLTKLEYPIPILDLPLEKQDKICYFYGNNNLLIEGQTQAQIITKTIVVENKLPEKLDNLVDENSEQIENLVQRAIKTSTIFNAYQEKLPKRKDPQKPTWNFPRDYGITSIRKIRNISNKFHQLCDMMIGPELANCRKVIHDGIISLPFEKESDLYQLKMTVDLMLSSALPLKPFYDKNFHKDAQLPNLHPIHHTVSFTEQETYKLENLYPINPNYKMYHIHTIFVHYDSTTIQNLTELPVLETQILAHSLMKSFSAAASYARQRFGFDVKDLPEPISVQCIQSDGKAFHFSVFQLNTLNLDGTEGLKNYLWSLPRMDLYEKSEYEVGKPVLIGYNPEVFKRILAFYKNT